MNNFSYKVKKPLMLLILMLAITGCKVKPGAQSNEPEITINIPQNRLESINIADFADSVSFIQLETTPECLINQVTKLFFTENRLIVVDGESNQIFVFDRGGKFINKISRSGRGPQEYIGVTSVNFDPVKQQILVLDGMSKKLLFYNLDGSFDRSIMDFSERAVIRDMINLPNGNYFCYSHDFCTKREGVDPRFVGLWEVDSVGNYINNLLSYAEYNPAYFSFNHSYFQMLSDGDILLRDGITSDIYNVKGSVLTKYIHFNIENSKLEALRGKMDFEGDESYSHSSEVKDVGGYIVSRWSDGNSKMFAVVYSKKDKKAFVIDQLDYFNSGIPAVPNSFLDNNLENVLISPIYQGSFSYYFKKPDLPATTRAKLESFQAGKTQQEIENMNPVLQILHVKK